MSAGYAWLTNTIPDFDSDADGIPDWWERQYSGDIQGLVATNDPDGDGFDNLAEWTALTDPTNAASDFRIASAQGTNGVVALTFQGWTNRYYRVFARDPPLTNGAWYAADSNAFAGAGGLTVWTDTNLPPASARFYRLGASLTP